MLNKNKGVGIRTKLFIGFGMITLLVSLAIVFVLIKVTQTENSAKVTINTDLPTYDQYLTLGYKINYSVAELNSWLLTHDPKAKTAYEKSWVDINTISLKLEQLASKQGDQSAAQWSLVKNLLSEIKNTQEQIINSSSDNVNQLVTNQLMPLLTKATEMFDGSLTATGTRINGIYDNQLQRLNQGSHGIIDNINNIRILEYLLIIVLLLVAFSIALITARKILTPIRNAIDVATDIASGKRDIDIVITSDDETAELLQALDIMQSAIREQESKLKNTEINTRTLFNNIVKTAMAYSSHSSKVASGDLTQRIEVDDSEEMGKLGRDLNLMTEGLANITRQITSASHQMVSMLTEVKHAIDSQSAGASEQASSINQITASLEEIEKSSAQTIEKAKQLGEVAERTRTKGEQGLDAVEQSVYGMKLAREKVQTIAQTILDLSHQTQQVGEITSVVNTLAQQSKMLALNASIEAAKAGEAGKGFAVVAAEVKSLAEQSEQSTAQVQKILEDIRHATEKAVMVTEEGTKGVDHGMDLVEQNGEVIRNLIDVIHEATIASQQIEAAIRQEGIGIEQITAGMNEINQVSASSIASVKQTTDAINNLSDITRNLKDQIEIYKV